MFKVNNINMLANYVLVLPDPHLETYQVKGKELGLLSPDFKYENGEKITVKEKNLSVFGTVYCAPSHLNFNLHSITKLGSENTMYAMIEGIRHPVNIGLHREMAQLTRNSVMYDTQIEIRKGDIVNFSYQAHKQAKDDKMIVDTELGEMYLIKYDLLYMTVDENYQPKKMLNGYVLVQPEEIEVEVEDGREIIKRDSGLVTLAPKSKLKKSRKIINGKVLLSGSICKGYLQQPDKYDFHEPVNTGDEIVYDPRLCQKVESDIHQIMNEKILHFVHRKDIKYIKDKRYD